MLKVQEFRYVSAAICGKILFSVPMDFGLCYFFVAQSVDGTGTKVEL